MEVYFDQELDIGSSSVRHSASEWHLTYDLLGVASFYNNEEGFLCIYNGQGSLITKAAVPGDGSKTHIDAIHWHPFRKILVVACDGGDIFCWNDDEQVFLTSAAHHTTTVSFLQWSPCGMRLVSADENGTLVGWTLDSKGQLDVVFHVELKDGLTRGVFRGCKEHEDGSNIRGLARAAVSGNEEALDLFSTFGPQSHLPGPVNGQPSTSDISFYAGALSGIIYLINSENSCVEVASSNYPIHHLLHYKIADQLIVVDGAPSVIQYQIKTNGSLEEISETKIAGLNLQSAALWAGNGILALMTGELSVRLIDLKNGDTYTLSLTAIKTPMFGEQITSMTYSDAFGILTAGTSVGNIQMWKFNADSLNLELEKQWFPQGTAVIKGAIKYLEWSPLIRCAVVNTLDAMYLLMSKPAYCQFKDQVAVVQLSAKNLALESFSLHRQIDIHVEFPVRGLDIASKYIVMWSGQIVRVHEINYETLRTHQVGNFPSNSDDVCLYNQSLYVLEGGKIQVKTFQGTVKQSLGFLDVEGQISFIDVCRSFLVAATSQGFLNVWDISRREAKALTNTPSVADYFVEFGKLISTRINSNGTLISMLFEKHHHLEVWNVESSTFLASYSVKNCNGKTDSCCSWLETSKIISHFWDPEEPRILACELQPTAGTSVTNLGSKLKIALFFVTSEHGIMVHDTVELDDEMFIRLMGVQIPNYYAIKWHHQSETSVNTATVPANASRFVEKISMKDFAGLEEGDHSTRNALMNFNFNLTIGNMDEAFKSIKKIKCNDKVWENMARTCVKTKRLDVALVCLGHMKNVKATRALRKVKKDQELEAQVATLALHLGMLQEAEQLYEQCGRYDLLNQFYQASGQWNKAIQLAETKDRVHLRTTYYNYARYLETKGDINGAITSYEKSQTHQYEVPRMLFDNPTELDKYISNKNDEKLFKWWAQYMESLGEMETALQYYEKSKDFLSLVRVYCYCSNLEKAAEIANDTGDRAANYHMGRQYENKSDIKKAVHFFSRAQAYSHAIRICKDQGMEDQLLNLAVMGSKADMIDVAAYYESKGEQLDHAVMLYHKGGLTAKAIELAFRSNQRSVMEQLAHDLDENTDPRVLRSCAEYFVESGQPDQAIKLLAKAKDFEQAITLCAENNVPLTEDMVESLTPAKNSVDSVTRTRILEKIAECCYQQEIYHLATKKYTQAGNKLQAMKALLKSGDTERIVFFANVSRQTDIYIMAANYLQTLDWHNDPSILQNIVVFYTKGKAPNLLAGFYETCAQTEIEEFQDYEKALDALNEAYKCVSGASTAGRNRFGESRLQQLAVKLEMVNAFLQAKRVYDRDSLESMKLCSALLKQKNVSLGIRPGDVYGFMIEHYARIADYKTAYDLIGELKSSVPNANLEFYVDRDTLIAIYRNLGIQVGSRDNSLTDGDQPSSLTFRTSYEDDEVMDENML